jgi:dCMP deaminase
MTERPSWDQTFGTIAEVWSQRSTCTRRQVGAVVVQGNKVIGQGYNGAVSKAVHCVDGGCPRGQLSYEAAPTGADYNAYPCIAIHAEHNAILQAGLENCVGGRIYTTAEPCQQCTNLIQHAGIKEVIVCPKS